MLVKWRDMAETVLDPADSIQKTYSGKLDGKRGYLMMSRQKLVFVHEEGFIRKTYDLTLDLPYGKIGKISPQGRYELEIADAEGVTHSFETEELDISIVEKSLEELRSPSE